MYEDSQKTIENSETMFSDSEPPSPRLLSRHSGASNSCHGCVENTKLLKQVLQELKELKEELSKNTNKQSPNTTGFTVEKSPIGAPLVEHLKKKFPIMLFPVNPDTELKAKVTVLLQKNGVTADLPVVLRSVRKYAARKFVDFRAQTKSKLLSEKLDVGAMQLAELARTIFSKFTDAGNLEIIKMTIILRSFCHEKKLLKKLRGREPVSLDFWVELKEHKERIDSDEDPLKWEKLQAREEKRIERYEKL